MNLVTVFNHIFFVLMPTLHFSDDCRQLEFMPDYYYDGKRLKNHVIYTTDVFAEGSCRTLCYMEPNCVSYNFNTTASDNGRHHCELNNATHEGSRDDLVGVPDYFYRGSKVSEFEKLKNWHRRRVDLTKTFLKCFHNR